MTAQSPGGNTHRNLIIADIVERTGIDDAMIDRLVRAFYARARLDPLLGPIFARNVGDWEAHFARMRDFWSSVALMSGRYHGQPMSAHLPLPIDTPHFAASKGEIRARPTRPASTLPPGTATAKA